MTVRQAAQKLGISLSLVYALCHEGVIHHTRHGRPGKRGTIRISEEALRDYRAGCEPDRQDLGDNGPLQFIH